MATIAELQVRIGADLSDLQKKLDSAQAKLQNFGQSMQMIGSKLTTGLTLPIVGIGAAMLKSAAEAEEMQGKFNVVFSKTGAGVTRALGEFAVEANRSKFELMGMASAFGDTLKPMGFVEESAANLSVDLVKLAVDLSSFNDMPMDEALRRLQGTLVGAHRNALEFGVVINENILSQELARMGADELTGAQLEQAKVQARINLLMQGTTDAQGDAIRTGDSLTNQLRGMLARLQDLRVEYGQNLIPAAKAVVDRLADMAGWFTDLDERTQSMILTVGGIAAALGPAALAISGVIALMNPWALGIAAVVAAGATLIARWEEISAWFTQRFPGVAETFTKAWNDIRSAVVDALARIQEFWNEWGDEITGVASAIFNHVVNIVQTGLSVVGDTLGLFINLFTGDWAGLWDNVKGIFGAVWDGIKSIFTNAINGLIALMPDFVREWLGLTDDFKIGASEMEAGTKGIEAATWNFKRSAEQTTDAVAGGSGSYVSALGSVASATNVAEDQTREITQTMEGLRKKLDDALIPSWRHYNGLVIQGTEANSELDASVLRTTTAVEDLEQPVNDLSIGFKGWVSILSSGSGVGSAIEHVKGKLGGAGGLIDLIGSETGLLGKLTGPGGLVGALGQGGLVGKLQSVTAALGPAGAAFAAVVGVVATYSDEINSAISATSEFLGFGDSAQDKLAEGILSNFQSSIIESFNASGMSASDFINFMESSDPGSVAAALNFGGFATVGDFEDFLMANGSYTAPTSGSISSANTQLSALLSQYSGISSDAGYLFDFLTGLNQFDYIVSSTDIGNFEAQDYLAGLLGLSYVTTESGASGFADTTSGATSGDVYFDGDLVGKWFAKETADGGLVI